MEKGWLGSEFKRAWTVITTDSNTSCFRFLTVLYLTPSTWQGFYSILTRGLIFNFAQEAVPTIHCSQLCFF